MVGWDYNYNALRITESEVLSLPTILLQIRTSYSGNKFDDPNKIPGHVGSLDSESPFDLLFAIPAVNYMEYDPISGKYKCRLSLRSRDESILGANAFQGRHINFDLVSPRI